jgi:hypothetical protein
MSAANTRLGRWIGALLLAQVAAAMIVNFALFDRVIAPPGWLVNAAAHSFELSLSVVLGMATDAVWLAIAIAAYPLFSRLSQRMALAFLTLAAIALALSAVENMALRSMLSLSEAYSKAAADSGALFETLRVIVGSSRNWAHFIHLMFTGTTIVTFFALLWRHALIARPLAAAGIAAAALQVVTVAAPIFGRPVIFPLLLPLGLAIIATAAWLLVKGLNDPRPQTLPGSAT